MRINVHFSSLFQVLGGVEREVMDVDEGTTLGPLSSLLSQKYQNLPIDSEKTYFVINDQIAAKEKILSEGDQVRIFQLPAGG